MNCPRIILLLFCLFIGFQQSVLAERKVNDKEKSRPLSSAANDGNGAYFESLRLEDLTHYPNGFKLIGPQGEHSPEAPFRVQSMLLLRPVHLHEVELDKPDRWYFIFSNPNFVGQVSPQEIMIQQSGKLFAAMHNQYSPFSVTPFSEPFFIVEASIVKKFGGRKLIRDANASLSSQVKDIIKNNFKRYSSTSISERTRKSMFSIIKLIASFSNGIVMRKTKDYETGLVGLDSVFAKKMGQFLADHRQTYLILNYGENLVLLQKSIVDMELDRQLVVNLANEEMVLEYKQGNNRPKFIAEIHAFTLTPKMDNLANNELDTSLFAIREYISNFNKKQKELGQDTQRLLYEDFQITVSERPHLNRNSRCEAVFMTGG